MFKPELWQSHNEYRTIVTTLGRSHPEYSFDSYEEERQKLLNLNLDPLNEYIPPFYSDDGRPAKHQAHLSSLYSIHHFHRLRIPQIPICANSMDKSIK